MKRAISVGVRRSGMRAVPFILATLGLLWGSMAVARVPNSGYLRWPLPAYEGITRGLGTPVKAAGSEEILLCTGIDIPAAEGTEVFAPFDADAVKFFLGDDLSIHLTNSALGNVLVLDHLDPKQLPSFLDGQSEGVQLSMNIKRGRVLGKARGEVHLEIRELASGDLLDPQGFFEETSNRDQTSPSIVRFFVKDSGGTFRQVLGVNLGDVQSPLEILVEAYDIKSGGVSMRSHVLPQRIRFTISGKEIQVIDLSRMKARCNPERGADCRFVLAQDALGSMFHFDSDLPEISSIPDDSSSSANDRSRFLFRSRPIDVSEFAGSAQTLNISVTDAGSGRSSASFFFTPQPQSSGSLGN